MSIKQMKKEENTYSTKKMISELSEERKQQSKRMLQEFLSSIQQNRYYLTNCNGVILTAKKDNETQKIKDVLLNKKKDIEMTLEVSSYEGKEEIRLILKNKRLIIRGDYERLSKRNDLSALKEEYIYKNIDRKTYTFIKSLCYDSLIPFYPKTPIDGIIERKDLAKHAYLTQRDNINKTIDKMEEIENHHKENARKIKDPQNEWKGGFYYLEEKNGLCTIAKQHVMTLYNGRGQQKTEFKAVKDKEEERIQYYFNFAKNEMEAFSAQEQFFYILELLLLETEFINRVDRTVGNFFDKSWAIFQTYVPEENGYRRMVESILEERLKTNPLKALKKFKKECEMKYFDEVESAVRKRIPKKKEKKRKRKL